MKNRKEYPIIDRDLVGGEDDFVNSGGEGEGEGDTVLLYTLSSSLLSFRSGRMRQWPSLESSFSLLLLMTGNDGGCREG